MAGKLFNRDVLITGGGRLIVNDVVIVDADWNIDAPVTTTDLTVSGTLGATWATTLSDTLWVTGLATFTAGILSNDDITLGAGDNLVGSSTSDILINTNKFTVAGATGNTVIAGTVTGAWVITNTIADLASAWPGTVRSIVGAISDTTTMTSGNIVGVRGAATVVSASGGFIYGTQGKVISSGTLSGSSRTAGVFGQLDVSAATFNAGQTATIRGDYGATSGTETDMTGARGIAMTNTTDAVLNAQDYRYGNATYLLELAGAAGTLNYYATAGTSAGSAGETTKCNANKVIVIQVNGAAAYIPVFTSNS